MPLVGTNFYGTQVQRTPWDDAEAQRTGSRDAWNMAQHQNRWADKRQSGTNAFNWAMNQDTLDFNAWNGQRQDDRADSRSLAALEAQRKLAELQNTWQTEGDVRKRGWSQEDFNTQVKPFQDRQLSGIDESNRIARENYEFNKSERQRLLDQRKAREQFMDGTPDTPLMGLEGEPTTLKTPGVKGFKQRVREGLSGDAMLAELATMPGGDVADMAPLVQIQQQQAQMQADRILQDLRSNDPAIRARGMQKIKAAPPEVSRLVGPAPELSELPKIDLNALPDEPRAAIGRGISDAVEQANTPEQGDYTGIGGAYGGPPKEVVARRVEDLRAQVRGMAAASPGVSPADLWRNIKDKLDQGGWSWNPLRGFGAVDKRNQDVNQYAIQELDREFGGFR